jgi:hypothetical protein
LSAILYRDILVMLTYEKKNLMEIFSFLKISMQINEKSRVRLQSDYNDFFGGLFISSYMRSKINVNFFTFWDFFRAIGLKKS